MSTRSFPAVFYLILATLSLVIAIPPGRTHAAPDVAASILPIRAPARLLEPTVPATRAPAIPPISPTPATPPSPAPACSEHVVNGGFEEDAAWEFPVTASRAGYTTAAAHGGVRSVRLGLTTTQDLTDFGNPPRSERNLLGELAPANASFSAVYQTISLPALAGSFTLTFFYKPGSQGADGDYQRVMLLNPDGYTYIGTLMQVLEAGDAWRFATFDLTPYRGQMVVLYFEVFNDNISAGPRAWMHLDDVSVRGCGAAPQTPTPTPSPTPAGNLTLTGYVYDAAAGRQQPVGGAMVTVDTCLHHSFATLTGTDGRYSLPIPGPELNACQAVTVRGWAPGYATLERTVTVAELRRNPQADFGLWVMGDITVTTTEDELKTDGDCSLREAIQAANSDQPVDACPGGGGSVAIALPAGTYWLGRAGAGEDANLTGDLDIYGDLKLIGRGPQETVLDGQGLDRVLDIHAGATVRINGLRITRGRTPDGPDSPAGEGDAAPGGGIANAGDMILSGCVISGNRTGDGGDLIETAPNGGPRGGSGGDGGGIHNSGAIQVYDTWVSNNTTGSGGTGGSTGLGLAGRGGGIFNAGKLTLDRATVEANATGMGGYKLMPPGAAGCAGGDGGGIFNAGAAAIVRSTVADNRAGDGHWASATHGLAGDGGHGGGIFNIGDLLLRQSTVSGNATGKGGAAWFCAHGGHGGGIASPAGALVLSNSTVSGNRTGDGGTGTATGQFCPGGHGGGIYTAVGATLDNVTLTANSTGTGQADYPAHPGGDGGGIYIEDRYASMRNTILAGNIAAGVGPDCNAPLQTPTLHLRGTNLIQDPAGCIGIEYPNVGPSITGRPPLLLPLGKYGGATQTHALTSGSPALDAGSCTDMRGDPVTEDQRGVSRPQGMACDIGAFEGERARINLPLIADAGTGSLGLLYFRAVPQDNTAIVLEWATAAEPDTVAFGIYRAQDPASPGPPITLIPAHGDAVSGAIYSYLDADLAPGVLYYYILARLTMSGGTTVIATASARTGPTPPPLLTATPMPSATPARGPIVAG